MSYGNICDGNLYKNIWIAIINFLPENQWYKLKMQNKTFYRLVKELCVQTDDIKSLTVGGQIESIMMMSGINIKFAGPPVSSETIGGLRENLHKQIFRGPDFAKQNYLGNLLQNKFVKKFKNYFNRFRLKINYDPDDILNYACMYGHKEIVYFMINIGATYWNLGLGGACKGSQMDMIELMISKGADNWDQALFAACQGGQKEIAELMIQKGAKKWDWALAGACYGGYMEIAEKLIENGADYWTCGLVGACQGGQMEMAQFMIFKGATDCNWGLKAACYGGHIALIELMILHGATNWNDGLAGACKGNQEEIAKLMIAYGANRCRSCWIYNIGKCRKYG